MKTPFQKHVQRVSMAEDTLRDRKTGVPCEYVDHPEGLDPEWDAVMIVRVDNTCCNDLANSEVRMCWQDVIAHPYQDRFQCACKGQDSTYESKDLTFVGEIKPADVNA